MTETLSGFAAFALLGFLVAFGLLMLFMALVQPIWCVVDCAIDGRRGTASKVVWILLLILLWSVANWFYGAFAPVTPVCVVDAAGLGLRHRAADRLRGDVQRARRVPPGIEKEWRDYRGTLVRGSTLPGSGPAA